MRPIFLVIDPPDPETLSTRKLVLESAKFNVVTAHTADEAYEIAERVPVHAIVLHTSVASSTDIRDVASRLKETCPGTLLVAVSPRGEADVPAADQVINSHDPLALVEFLSTRFGWPKPSGETTHAPTMADARRQA